MRYPRAYMFGAVFFVSVLFCSHLAFRSTSQYQLPPHAGDLTETSAMFNREISTFGAKEAYRRFSVAMKDLDVGDQHAYAHAFGHQLYRIEGERGIGTCDDQFSLGCFHQFLGDAIAEKGEGSIRRLYDECATIVGSKNACQHGLGHGVLAGTGYGETDLERALEICYSVTKEHTYAGCEGGAFMEFNMRTIAIAEGVLTARTDASNLYAPCDALAPAYHRNCIFWLPQWWYYTVFASEQRDANLFPSMGSRCARSEYPQACYEGIGYITPTVSSFDATHVRTACDSLGEADNANMYCRAMAALIFHLTVGVRDTASVICDGLEARERGICLQYAAHDTDFSFSVDP